MSSLSVKAGISGNGMARQAVLLVVCATATAGALISETTSSTPAFVSPSFLRPFGSRLVSSSQAKTTQVSPLAANRKLSAATLKCAQKDEWEQFVVDLQSSICSEAETADGKSKFIVDRWERGEGKGYGITRVLEGGDLWEKAACSVSVVSGELTKDRAEAMSSRGRDAKPGHSFCVVCSGPPTNLAVLTHRAVLGQPYSAAACSLVFHSASPLVPTFRADVRHFQIEGGAGWYGGGADLTPYYLNEDDARSFHEYYKDVCDRHDPSAYDAYKAWCDKYFYIPARKEHRGVGGIFFDDLALLDNGNDPLPFVKEVAEGFMPSYLPLVEKSRHLPFTEEQRQWQLLRRGRYLEFNLLYDRGVRFGLDGQGRTESVMVSAPPLIAWKYNVVPEPGSPEEKLVSTLQNPRQWVQ